jgi:hypothetical protein
MAPKIKHIRGMLTTVVSSRLQYKPYLPTINFQGSGTGAGGTLTDAVLVEVDIPAELVLEEGPGYVVVGLDGLNAILEVTADSLDKLDAAYKKKIQKGVK